MQTVVQDLVGLTAARFLSILFSSLHGIREIRVATCVPLPPLQERLNLTESERIVFEQALMVRNSTGLSFWDAALLQLPVMPDAVRLLDVAMMHVSLREHERKIPWSEVRAGGA